MKVFAALSLTALLSTSALAGEMRPKWSNEDAGSFLNPYVVTDDDGNTYEAKAQFPNAATAGSFTNPFIVELPDGQHTIKESPFGSDFGYRMDTGEHFHLAD